MPGTEPAKPLAPAKRLLGLLGLVLVVIVSMLAGLWVSGGLNQGGMPAEEEGPA